MSTPIAEESFPITQPAQLQQLSTEEPQDDNTDNPYKALQAHERKAVDMRLSLLPYREIQKEMQRVFFKDLEEQSIRRWFMKDRPCRIALEYLQEQQVETMEKDRIRARDYLELTAYDAIGLIYEVVTGTKSITAQQQDLIKEVLDRGGFPKTSKIEGKQNIESESMGQLASAMIGIAESIKK